MSITCNKYTSMKTEGVQVDHGLEGQEKSNNVSPCGVFFTLFLRSFILLRELENVGPPRLGP